MSKLLHSHLFRFLICFLVVCCILVNCSPIKARAVVVEALAVKAIDILAWAFLAYMGLVVVPQSVADLNAIGDSLDLHLQEHTFTDAEQSELEASQAAISAWLSGHPGDDDGELDEDEFKKIFKPSLPKSVLLAIAGWAGSLIVGALTIKARLTAATNFCYYNGHLLPEIPEAPEGYSNSAIVYYLSSQSYRVYYSSEPFWFYIYSSGTYELRSSVFNTTVYYRQTSSDGSSWGTQYSKVLDGRNSVLSGVNPIWSNHDILNQSDQSIVILSASDPSLTWESEEDLTLNTFGDIPTQIQEGIITPEEIELPSPLDLSKVIEEPDTVLDSLTDLGTQIVNNNITYNEYTTMVNPTPTPGTDVDPGTGTETLPATEPSEDPGEATEATTVTEPWEPPEDPGQFALDLSEVFPFCIPFDLYDFLSLLNADPVAPVIDWEIALPGGGSYPLRIDLSPFDSVAQLLRRLQLLLFIVALGIKTRDLIKG